MDFLDRYSLLIELLGLLSMLTFIGSLIAIPWIIGLLPVDYFIHHRRLVERRQHPVLAKLIFSVRNIFGVLFLLAGLLMLVLPGQGFITILIGISFMDFPGKSRIIDFLVCRPRVIRLLNWIRRKEKKPPFEF
ncbi:MAG: PGPGW domain-containing protein [Desulfobulbaceae bacterium]|nr:PGPGW domain-containing protein [Desulfobulbaceae bacterium]